jgi:hypothetical protein
MSQERLKDKDLEAIIDAEAERYAYKKAEKRAISGHEFPPDDVIEEWKALRNLESTEFALAILKDINELSSQDSDGIEQP